MLALPLHEGLASTRWLRRPPLQVAFIFTDAEVREEAFLEYINQLLATGEVAGLFGRDEVDGIVNDVRPIMRAEAPGGTAASQFNSVV